MTEYPSIADLEKRARRRMPRYAWEYLDSGTGSEECLDRNRAAFRSVTLIPRFLKGAIEPDTTTRLFGTTYAAPFGVAPIGLSGLMWPRAESLLAASANRSGIPYALSTVGNETPEVIGPIAGEMGWFQLYPPRDGDLRRDLLRRAADAGFKTLLVTADVPVSSRRERQVRAGLTIPPKITPRMLYRSALRPRWSLATLRAGPPRFRTLEAYAGAAEMRQVAKFVGDKLGGTLSWDYLEETRREWAGPLVLKGILDVGDARRAVDAGVDGIVVSNHGGRQFDGAPASLSVLPEIKQEVGSQIAVLFDSGVRGSLDIARAIAMGADFVLLGRAFIYGVAALGSQGGDHTAAILKDELRNVMIQLGCRSIGELSKVPWHSDAGGRVAGPES